MFGLDIATAAGDSICVSQYSRRSLFRFDISSSHPHIFMSNDFKGEDEEENEKSVSLNR